MLKYVYNVSLFVVLAMIAQALGGFGAGTNTTVCFSLIITFFPEDKQKLIGILEAGIGLGLLLGPLIGVLLYQIGGYSCPFWTLGFIFLATMPLLNRVLNLVEACASDRSEPLLLTEQSSTTLATTQGDTTNTNVRDDEEPTKAALNA